MQSESRTESRNLRRGAHVASGLLIFSWATGIVPIWYAEVISQNFLGPLVAGFTDLKWVVGAILALNPFFGFTVQPYVGWKSDRIATRFGRRRPFIYGATLPFCISAILIPFSPNLAALALTVAIFQFCVDMFASAYNLLLFDLIPAQKRTIATGWQQVFGAGAMLVGMWVGGVLYDIEQYWPFVLQPVLVFGSLFLVAKYVREPAYETPLASDSFRPASYVADLLAQPALLRLFAFIFVQQLGVVVMQYFATLYAAQHLKMTVGTASQILTIAPLLTLFLAAPVGMLAARIGKKPLLLAAILFFMAGCVTNLFADSPSYFYLYALFYGLAFVGHLVPLFPFVGDFLPEKKRGQLAAATVIFIGSARTIAPIIVGALIDLTGGYHVVFAWALLLHVLSIPVLLSVGRGR